VADIKLEERPELGYCAFPMTAPIAELSERIPVGYRRLDSFLAGRGIEDRGPSIIRYRRGWEAGTMDIEVGWTMDVPPMLPAPFIRDVLPGGTYAVAWHNGPYALLGDVTQDVLAWADKHKVECDVSHEPEGERWGCWYELYLTEPTFGPQGPQGTVEICLLVRS